MRLLLDTNILIPLLSRNARTLPSAIVHMIEQAQHEMVASAASLWEMAIKMRIGKLQMDCHRADLPRLTRDLGLTELPISHAHAVADVFPEPTTRDPFDRLLLCQCEVESLKLVTLDRALATHPLAWR